MQPATIKIFLVHGLPEGLRTAEISNWSGKAIACPRSHLKDLLNREEVGNPGIYFLNGTDPETGNPFLYIGEAENAGKRIRKHRDKDNWVNVILFVSKDENLTKAHIRYLEGKLIEKAKQVEAAILINTTSSGAKLPEPEAADMDVFLDKVYQLLPILGFNFFTEIEPTGTETEGLLFCKIKGLVAKGKRTPHGFIVFKGSQAVLNHRPSAKWTKIKREELIQSGILVDKNDHYVFSRDLEFGSPSTAGSIVRGGATNGLTAWKNSDGKTLKEIEKEI